MSNASRKVVVGFALGVLALLAVDFIDRHRSRATVRALKASLVATGEKLTIGELAPQPSAAAQAAVNALLQAALRLRDTSGAPGRTPGAMKMISPGKARVAWRQQDLRQPGLTNTWKQMAADFDKNHETLDQIRELLKQPGFGFNLNYHQGFSLLLPHLAPVKMIAQRLSAATLEDLHTGRLDEAAADLEALLALPETLRNEPLIVSQLVRAAIAAIAFSTTWEALQADGWTDAPLASLQRQWEILEFMTPMQRAQEMERAIGLDTFDRARRSSAFRQQFFSGFNTGPGGRSWPSMPSDASGVPDFVLKSGETALSSMSELTTEQLWRWRWSYQDELRYLQILELMLQVPRQVASGEPFVAAQRHTSDRLARFWSELDRPSKKYLFSGMSLPSLEKYYTKGAQLEMQREMAIAALALKRHQLRYREPAPSLSALVLEFLPRVPRDFMDGGELRYRVNLDGTWILYSVGENGMDDGGDPDSPSGQARAESFTRGRDAVWPQPATPEEIARVETTTPPLAPQRMSREMMKRYGLIPRE